MTFDRSWILRATHTNFPCSLVPRIVGGPGDARRAALSEGGYSNYELQAFEPRLVGGPETDLQNVRPETIERVASIKTSRFSYVERPHGVSELYDRSADPMETENLAGTKDHAQVENDLRLGLPDWYINTSGVSGMTRDARAMPPWFKNETFPDAKRRTKELPDN